MLDKFNRYFLLVVGTTLALIGIAYCIDPNLILTRYELNVSSASEDNMYRGAYGGLFITVGVAVACGYFSESIKQISTLIALIFMGGFAIGRVASVLAIGMPHQQIVSLLVIEMVSSALLVWFLCSQQNKLLNLQNRS